MSPSGAELRERIEVLLSARDASVEEVEEALTAGYGYALSLDSQRLRIERRISELAAHAEDPEAAGELRKLWLRSRTLVSELSELRALLAQLKATRLPAAR
jgi:hypothetical protein